MNNEVRKELVNLVATYGSDEISTNIRKVEGLLRDYCGEHKREIAVLISAMKNRIPEEILNAKSDAIESFLSSRLIKRLYDNEGTAKDFAQWAVESWTVALGKKIETNCAAKPEAAEAKRLKIEELTRVMELNQKTLDLNPGHEGAGDSVDSIPIKFINKKDGSEMTLIPSGEFLMGAGDNDEEAADSEKPQHEVHLDAYYISKYPVTVAQYREFCNDTGRQMYRTPDWRLMDYYPIAKDDHPRVTVTWDDAVDYCRWAGGRLPTEAEWEKAARGTDGRKYPWGDDKPHSGYANYSSKWFRRKITPVANYSKGASPYGVLDMAGNVCEWCSDWFSEGYYEVSPGQNPKGPQSGSYRVIRGGCFNSHPNMLRVSARDYNAPNCGFNDRGFRLARTP